MVVVMFMLSKVMIKLLQNKTDEALLLVIDALLEQIRVLKLKYEETGKRLNFNDEERRTLAEHGKWLVANGFKEYIQIVKPDTLMRWYNRLVAKKYDSSKKEKTVGRPKIAPHICKLILKMARENRSWGSERIHGQLKNLDIEVSTEAIRQLLRKHNIFPKPDKESQGTWKEFIERHKNVLWATDFFTKEILTITGIKTYYILFFIHLETRKVQIAGMTENPDGEWMKQQARNLTDYDNEFSQASYLIHDRDSKYTDDFQMILKSSGIKCIKLPPKSPDLNAYAERFVRSIKSECLSKFIPLSKDFLEHIIKEYVEHYHHERNHQGEDIGNELLFPEDISFEGDPVIKKKERLGGLLNYYYHDAA